MLITVTVLFFLTECFPTHSAVNKEGQSAPRTGFFHFFKRQEVYMFKQLNKVFN